MTHTMRVLLLLAVSTLVGPVAWAQGSDSNSNPELTDSVALIYVNSLINYAFDVEWQFDWERRKLAGNALRVNAGSVKSDKLLTDIDLKINERLNDKWLFIGRFRREAMRRRPQRNDRLLLGFERSILASSAVYLAINPEYDKAYMDIAAGYSFYGDDREQYIRVGLLAEDFNFEDKNTDGGLQQQSPLQFQWTLRKELGDNWWLYSEGEVGSGFERVFPDAAASPELGRHNRSVRLAQIRVSREAVNGAMWSAWIDWFDFAELKEFRSASLDYEYDNTQFNIALEHTRLLAARHRLRLLAHYVDESARLTGSNARQFDRREFLGGIFYEYLWPSSRLFLAYSFGAPDIELIGPVSPAMSEVSDYNDKVAVGWLYRFSDDAQLRMSISHEASAQGFGGANVQYQMFF